MAGFSSGTSGGWRDKYLKLLEDSDHQKKRSQAQIKILTDAVQQTAGVANGVDPSVDRVLRAILNKIETGNLDIAKSLDQLESLASQLQGHRTNHLQGSIAAYQQVLTDLAATELPNHISKAIDKLNTNTEQQLSCYTSQSETLAKLLDIQKDITSLLAKDRPQRSLWEKVFGNKSLNQNDSSDTSQEGHTGEENVLEQPISEHEYELGEDGVEEAELTAGKSQENTSNAKIEIPENLPPVPGESNDSGYNTVVERIPPVLLSFLDSLVIPGRLENEAKKIRASIEKGLRWYELVSVLESLRDLMLSIANPQEFMNYLAELNSQLGDIRSALGQGLDSLQALDDSSQALSSGLQVSVSDLQNSVDSAEDLEQLKSVVNTQLNDIRQALVDYQNQRDQIAQDGPLLETIKQLLKRIDDLEKQSMAVQAELEEQRKQALHDSLTGLPNRAAYLEKSEQEFQRWKRYGNPLSIAIADIDFFKKINDTYGHQAGDKVLQVIAKVINKRIRNTDFIARFGGEEFVFLLPETNLSDGIKVLEKVRETIAHCPFHFKGGDVQITSSFGIAEFSADNDTVDIVLARADSALYKAKEQGRNRVVKG